MRLNCCDGGNALNLEQAALNTGKGMDLIYLKPLTKEMEKLFKDNVAHLSRASSFYNNLLAMCSTGVDNGKQGGFEKRIGAHAVTICGRIYHHFPKVQTTNPSGGLGYFMFDHVSDQFFLNHVNRMNKSSNENIEIIHDYENTETVTNEFDEETIFDTYEDNLNFENNNSNLLENTIDINIIKQIKTFLLNNNPYVHELQSIGQIISSLPTGRSMDVRAALSGTVQYFDVAHITSDSVDGQRVLNIRANSLAPHRNE
jgi:hypothetical protein